MKGFDRKRYLSIQQGAVNNAARIDGAVSGALSAWARNIFFMGAGGAAILKHPAAQMLVRQSDFPVFSDISAEVLAAGHRQLGRGSIVVIPSLSGTTPESVEMADHCRKLGATVLALVGNGDSPVARAAHHVFVNAAADDTSSESFYVQSLVIALSLLKHRGGCAEYDKLVADLALLPDLLADMKEGFDGEAAQLAKDLADVPWLMLTAAGNCWPEAWYFGMCILEEMQWIRTRPVHASDFFHGPLELVEKGVSVMLLKGEDDCRPLVERALAAPAVLAAALERVSVHLAELRDHPLTTRRYYRRFAY